MNENVDWVFYISEGIRCLDGTPVAAEDITTFTTGTKVSGGQPPYKILNYHDIEPIFKNNCLSCHNGADKAFGGIDFSSGQTVKDTLINAGSVQWPGWNLVNPYKPGKSYLLFKIIDNNMASGGRMPEKADLNGSAEPLSSDSQQDVSDWIAGGSLF
jgi:hypothetical protein